MAAQNRVVVWGGVVAAFAAASGVAYVTTMHQDAPASPASTAAPAPPRTAGVPSTGQLPVVDIRKTDPGQEYYRQGRYDLAIAFWTKSAETGDALAAHQLGVEYMDGKPWVVPRDYDKARKYHLQAAEAGDPRSMFDLGSMYEFGLGVTTDLKQAATWYGHAADYGHAQGAYNLATMLESGEAGHKDEVEAYKFYLIATDNGFGGVPYDNQRLRIDRDAPQPIDLLAKRLSKAQIADATSSGKGFQDPVGAA